MPVLATIFGWIMFGVGLNFGVLLNTSFQSVGDDQLVLAMFFHMDIVDRVDCTDAPIVVRTYPGLGAQPVFPQGVLASMS